MDKELYATPDVEINALEVSDVIATSDGSGDIIMPPHIIKSAGTEADRY